MHINADDQPRSMKPSAKMARVQNSLSEPLVHARLLGGFASVIPITLHHAIETVRQWFKADAAGIYLHAHEPCSATPHPDLICGVLSSHEDVHASFGRGLCKMSLNAGATIVLPEQEVELTYLRHIRPRIRHVMMAPIYDSERRELGMVWLAQVSSELTYSRADALALGRLTHVLAVGIKVVSQPNEQENVPSAVEVGVGLNPHSTGATHLHAKSRQKHSLHPLGVGSPRTNAFDDLAVRGSPRTNAFDDLAVREAHHRVKNTLQIVDSLLSLQAQSSSHAETKSALREASARLRVLAHTHECLYKASSASREISVHELLRLLSHTVPSSFAETAATVRLQLTASELLMPPAEASTIALIANEVLTNAYKHAFPKNTKGAITIELERDTESTILRIADNGNGGGLQVDSRNFGLRLVRGLAEQLGASIDFSSHADKVGTTFTLRVPRKVGAFSSNDQADAFGSTRGVTVKHSALQASVIGSATTATALDGPMLSSA